MNCEDNNVAMSLTELVVATAMVGVIMVGVLSADYAIRRMQKLSSDDQFLNSRAHAAMLHLTKDALRAVGEPGNPGVVYYRDVTDAWICFRYDADNVPGDYTNDLWNCYKHGWSCDLYRWPDMLAAGEPPYPYPGLQLQTPLLCEDYDDGVQVYPKGDYFQVNTAPDGQITSIDFTLVTVIDQNSTADPIKNPVNVLTSSVNPPGLGQ